MKNLFLILLFVMISAAAATAADFSSLKPVPGSDVKSKILPLIWDQDLVSISCKSQIPKNFGRLVDVQLVSNVNGDFYHLTFESDSAIRVVTVVVDTAQLIVTRVMIFPKE